MIHKHLAPMVRDGLIVWNDEQIKPGAMWRDELETALLESKVAILPLSLNYLASKFITYTELPSLIMAAKIVLLHYSGFLVDYCVYEHTDIAKVQCVLSPTRLLSTLNYMELNKALSAFSQAIFNAIKYD